MQYGNMLLILVLIIIVELCPKGEHMCLCTPTVNKQNCNNYLSSMLYNMGLEGTETLTQQRADQHFLRHPAV